MTAPRLRCGLALALAIAGCATGDDAVRRDVAGMDPWCEREIRAAREQPVSADASVEEARALRGQHVSARCARAWNEAHGVSVRFGRHRVPAPVPLPGKP